MMTSENTNNKIANVIPQNKIIYYSDRWSKVEGRYESEGKI